MAKSTKKKTRKAPVTRGGKKAASRKHTPEPEPEEYSSSQSDEYASDLDDDELPRDDWGEEELAAMDSSSEEGSSDDDSGSGRGNGKALAMFGESSDEDAESEEELDIEREARELEDEQGKVEEESQKELTMNIEDQDHLHMPLFDGDDRTEDLHDVFHRIQEITRILNDFRRQRAPNRSRGDYLKQLISDVTTYFGYNKYIATLVFHLFSASEALEFLEANESPRPVTIRVNTLKERRRDLMQALINRGVSLEPLKWSKVGLQVFESQVPIGATPEYLAGHYMLQGASSFMPVMALDPQEGDQVLDLCAAPGGKTAYIAAMMKNSGLLWANDSNKERCKAIVGNLHRLGVKNCMVTNYDGRKLPPIAGQFDRALVDAPCTGLGVISRDPSIKMQKDRSDMDRCFRIQQQLLLAAIDMVRTKGTGSIIVYSTCSISVMENEQVVQFALEKRNVRLIETGLEFGEPGLTRYKDKRFHPSMTKCRRYYPHTHNMDGFFVAKFRKLADPKKNKKKQQQQQQKKKKEQQQKQQEQERAQEETRDSNKAATDDGEGSDVDVEFSEISFDDVDFGEEESDDEPDQDILKHNPRVVGGNKRKREAQAHDAGGKRVKRSVSAAPSSSGSGEADGDEDEEFNSILALSDKKAQKKKKARSVTSRRDGASRNAKSGKSKKGKHKRS